jgi:hypothetical protein
LIGTTLPLSAGSPPSRILTYYFRATFANPLPNLGRAHLVFSNYLDDGAVFYLNGAELNRVRLPADPITYSTFATNSPLNGGIPELMNAMDIQLLPGTNVLAVEVHQQSPTSPDVVFGSILRAYPAAETPVQIVSQPQHTSVPPDFPSALAPEVWGSYPIAFQWFKDGIPLSGETNRILVIPQTAPGDIGFYTASMQNALGSALSEPAFLDILQTGLPPAVVTRGPYLQQATPSSIRVRWSTDVLTPSEVRFGTHPNNLDHSAASPLAAINHELLLDDLLPETRYHYEIWNTRSNLAGGNEFYFITAPAQPKLVRVWAQGDPGTALPAARRVADAYLEFTGDRETDVWLMLGDNAYGVGSDANYQGAVFNMFPDILRRVCLWPTIGNHDILSTDPNGDNAYFNIFSLPDQGQAGGLPSGTENYYSFNHGNIHFVCLDSEQSAKFPGSPMLQWLEADLEANTNDWLIAYWHSPPYTRGSHNSDNPIDSFGNMIAMR